MRPFTARRVPARVRAFAALGAVLAAGTLGPLVAPPTPAGAQSGGAVIGVQRAVGIFAMQADGAGLHFLLRDPTVLAAAGAPGSDLIAYGGSSGPTLTVATLDGTKVESIGASVPGGSITSVAWSPDGQRLAYTVCPPGLGSCQIGVSTADGTSTTTVPAPAGVTPDRGLSWGAQGLFVAGSYTSVTGCAGCPAGIYVLDPSGQVPPAQVVAPGGANPQVGQPAVASTGAFAYAGGPVNGPLQVQVSQPGSPPVTVRGAYTDPTWSPDGSVLLFTNGYQIMEDNPAGGAPQAIATFAAYGVSSLSWMQVPGSTTGCSVGLPPGSVQAISPASSGTGYWITDAYGAVSACGTAQDYGGLAALHLNQPVLAVAGTPDGAGYWLVAYDGGVFTFGDARLASLAGAPGVVSLASIHLAAPIWAMAPTRTGKGYWLVGTDGGVFTFGDAAFYGSARLLNPSHPVVGMAATRSGRGYWVVTSDGSAYAFGDAGNPLLGAGGVPTVAIATDPAVPQGYWLVDANGAVRGFGGAPSLGSASSSAPVRGIAATTDGKGYWVVDANGTVYPFGDAVAAGSAN